MRSITEIEPDKFGCFYFSQLSGDISIFLLSPDGDIEYSEYEAFSAGTGTVVAFNHFNPQSTDYAYLLKCGEQEEIIQFQVYENLIDVLNGNDNHNNAFYAFFGSKSVLARVEQGEHLFVPIEEHCDKHIYGAAPFFELQDGINETLLDFSKFNFSNITEVFPVLAIQGEACIMRITMKEEDGSYRNYPAVTAIAKTLLGLLRMSCEWRAFTKEPFNNTEFPALKISAFMNKLGITSEIEEQIRISQSAMHVEKFITEPEKAREEIEETGIIPENLKQVLKSKLRYRTLSSLRDNTLFEAQESVLSKEKVVIESIVYSFMINNNINFDVFSSIDDAVSYIKTATLENIQNASLGIYEYLEKMKAL